MDIRNSPRTSNSSTKGTTGSQSSLELDLSGRLPCSGEAVIILCDRSTAGLSLNRHVSHSKDEEDRFPQAKRLDQRHREHSVGQNNDALEPDVEAQKETCATNNYVTFQGRDRTMIVFKRANSDFRLGGDNVNAGIRGNTMGWLVEESTEHDCGACTEPERSKAWAQSWNRK